MTILEALANCNHLGYAPSMPYRPFRDQNCSIAAALSIVGERWSMLVMREVLLGRRRFAEIREHTGAAPNILSDRLHTLVEHGLLERRLYSARPESYEYIPTPKGVDLNPVFLMLMQWGDRYAAPHGPPRIPVHTRVRPRPARAHLGHCGEVIGSRISPCDRGPEPMPRSGRQGSCRCPPQQPAEPDGAAQRPPSMRTVTFERARPSGGAYRCSSQAGST